MRFSGVFGSSLLVMALATTWSFAAPAAGKVRSALGDVTRLKEKDTDWTTLRVGAKVFHSDHVRTGAESEAVLGLPDGSLITIEEQSEVVLSDLLEKDGAFKTNINIKSGRLSFSVQKQNKNSTFEFKTGTGTAAIRGTEGAIDGGDIFVAGLRNGALEISTNSGKTTTIKGGETVFEMDSLVTMQLASSGDPRFNKRLVSLLKDKKIKRKDLFKKIRHDDSTYQKKLADAKKGILCSIEDLPDTMHTQQVQIKGKCPANVTVALQGQTLALNDDGSFNTNIVLDASTSGPKTFKLTCSTKKFSFPCGEASTNYYPLPPVEEPKEGFTTTTSSPVNICNDGLVVEGSYLAKDAKATLILTIGNNYKSENIIKVADGKTHSFSQKILISDANALWNEKTAVLSYESDNWNESVTFDLSVNKTCKSVNQTPPAVSIVSYDSLRCVANVSIENLDDDTGIFTTNIDNAAVSAEVLKKNASKRINLTKGIHEYGFVVEDQAGNKTSVAKSLGCYPAKKFSVNVDGGAFEKLRVPPPPVDMKDVIQRTLRFHVRLPENDPTYLYKVVVKQNGKPILQESQSQIQSLDYDVPVELLRNKANKFEIDVIGKSGYKARAQKVYEVR